MLAIRMVQFKSTLKRATTNLIFLQTCIDSRQIVVGAMLG